MPILKKCLYYIFVLLIIAQCARDNSPDETNSVHEKPIAVMTYNIKYDNPSDSLNSWNQRRDEIIRLLRFYEPDFLGVQEALFNQIDDLDKSLPNMSYVGKGRDGGTSGEFSALFYNYRRFDLAEDSDSTLWLSPTPEQPSKGWDAAFPRILTWGKFRDKSTEHQLYVFNTHFDHKGDTARIESAKLILSTIEDQVGNAPAPYLLMGDFNITPDAEPYAILTGPKSNMQDTYTISAIPPIGPQFTFEGFEVLSEARKRRIDYVFVSDKIEVSKYAIIPDFRNGRYPSDHLPVYTELVIPKY